jgi:hypothetical protein
MTDALIAANREMHDAGATQRRDAPAHVTGKYRVDPHADRIPS